MCRMAEVQRERGGKQGKREGQRRIRGREKAGTDETGLRRNAANLAHVRTSLVSRQHWWTSRVGRTKFSVRTGVQEGRKEMSLCPQSQCDMRAGVRKGEKIGRTLGSTMTLLRR
jgi:hypothetical protein